MQVELVQLNFDINFIH